MLPHALHGNRGDALMSPRILFGERLPTVVDGYPAVMIRDASTSQPTRESSVLRTYHEGSQRAARAVGHRAAGTTVARDSNFHTPGTPTFDVVQRFRTADVREPGSARNRTRSPASNPACAGTLRKSSPCAHSHLE